MPKRNKALSSVQAMAARSDQHQAKRKAIEPTPEQIAKGDYQRGFVTHADDNTKSMAHVSHRDPVMRWYRAKQITDMQLSTINHMQNLWQAVHGGQKLTASYSEAFTGPSGGFGYEAAQERELRLRDALRRIEGHFVGLSEWYRVFENACRFGFINHQDDLESSAPAARAARAKALLVVQFVADMIAVKEGR